MHTCTTQRLRVHAIILPLLSVLVVHPGKITRCTVYLLYPSLLCNISIHLTAGQVQEWYSYSGCVLFVVLWGFFWGGCHFADLTGLLYTREKPTNPLLGLYWKKVRYRKPTSEVLFLDRTTKAMVNGKLKVGLSTAY